ncbi:S-adenosyl-L-methionine-dependent methyltransferase [Aspergillus flavus]|uniref:S-adenosyl-L-methionine-dependent methyltransferase n=1 Tax=Aspergillus flavus (strain ATCC 200026 / FGSC A1120 / IAM 13836 / NRRL 3357 / JCM 12722 / SRRC 167) TaxID=332952 RepID=A0A7U2R284_ASPFN|nr:S-adenosyl-L-methionine-dependent methyltransferase [Aspergillus flavus]
METDLQNTSTSQGKLVVPFWIYGCCSLSGVVSVVGRRLRAEWPLSSVINRGAMGYNMDKVLPYPSSANLLQPPYISSTERTTIMDAPLTDAERTALQTSLEALNRQVEATRNILRSNSQKALLQTLHTDQELPDPALEALAGKTINLLHETQQLLEPGHLVLADHFLGYVSTKCLCAAVELKLVDILADADEAGMTVDELADASGAHPDRLQQVLRVLRNDDIFDYDAVSNRYRNNRVSALLHSEHWTQWHNWVDLYGNEFYDIARGIPRSIRREEARWAAQINFDTHDDMFTYFQAQGWLPRLHRTLGGGAIAQAPGIVADYPWHEIGSRTVLDVGGGGGGFLASLLREYPQMRGGILDLPRTIEHACTLFHEPQGPYFDLRERVPRENLIAGDFLKAVPAFEIYTMKWVLHDWKDPDVLTILRCIRASLIPGPDSRLVILESNLSDGQMGRLSRYGDINMMMTANGQERSEEQWRALAAASGWEVSRIYPMRRAWVCAIDLRPSASESGDRKHS